MFAANDQKKDEKLPDGIKRRRLLKQSVEKVGQMDKYGYKIASG
jgi:hypothetical protein